MAKFLTYLLEANKKTPSKLQKDVIQLVQQKDIKEAFEMLKNIILDIQEDYGKCLAVLNLFDRYSLGTLSEKLLVYFINSKYQNHAKALGGSGQLTDIQVKTSHGWFNLSVKTTDSNDVINLGTLEKTSSKINVNDTIKKLKADLNYIEFTKQDNSISIDKLNNDDVNKRLDAIVEKLCGPDDNPEIFCWIKKVVNKKTKILTALQFDIRKFNKLILRSWLGEQYIYFTDKSYGVKTINGTIIISADSVGKYLNITPKFLDVIKDNKDIIEVSTLGNNDTIRFDKLIEPIEKINKKYISSDGEIKIDKPFIDALKSLY